MGEQRREAERTVVSTVPRLPRVHLPRTTLVRRIDAAVTAGVPVVVHGPVGAGKTVLVAEWARSTADPVAWVALEPVLDDRAAFWTVVVDALDDIGAVPPVSPLRALDATDPTFRRDLARGMAGLRSAGSGSAGSVGRLGLVLDDAHLVQAVAIRDDLLAVLALDGRLRVVLAARATGRDDLTVLTDADPVAITPEDLRLDTAETSDLVGAILGTPAPPAVVVQPLAPLAGHVGGIVQAARVVADDGHARSDVAARLEVAARQAVRAGLDRLLADPEVRRFVDRTAVLDRLPPQLAGVLGGTRAPLALLERVAGFGLGGFTLSRDASTRDFVYAPPIVAAIRAAAAAERPMEYRTLLRDAVLWSLERDRTLLALTAAVDLDDMDLLSSVVHRSWTRIVGPLAIAAAPVLGRVAVQRAADHPIVLAAAARVSAAAGEHHARATSAHTATIGAVARRLATATRPSVVFLRALESQARRIVGDSTGSHSAAQAAEGFLGMLTAREADELRPVLPFVLHQIAAASFAEGAIEHALYAFSRIEPVADAPDGDVQRTHALTAGALVHGLVGEVRAARRMLEEAGDTDLPTAVLTRALLALEDFEPERALALLAAVDPLFGAFEHWPIVLTLRARAAIVVGRVSAADYLAEFDAQAERFRLRAPATGTAARLLGLSRARLLLAAGQLQRAEVELDQLGPLDRRTAPERASMWLVRDDTARALDVVATTLARSPYTARASSLLVLVRAAAELRLGMTTEARAGFLAVVDVLERTGLRSVLLEVPREDVDALVADAAEHGDHRAQRMFRLARRLRSALPDVDDTVVLSHRESVVLGLLAGPSSLAAIATELHVSVNTVKTQTRSVYRKLGVGGRREAIEAAHARGLVG